MSDLFFYAPILVFMLTIMFVALTISGMLNIKILIVNIDSVTHLSRSLKYVQGYYYDHGEIVDVQFSTYKKITKRKHVPVLMECKNGYDILHRSTLCLSVAVGVALCSFVSVLGMWIREYVILFAVCGALCASCMLLLLYTIAVRYKHARLTYERTERSACHEVFQYHYRKYYCTTWFKLIQLVLFGLVVGAFTLLYYDPSFKANTEAVHAITGIECSELIPKTVKYAVLSEYYTDPDVLSNTVHCNGTNDFEALLEHTVSANIYQNWLSQSMWESLLAVVYIVVYILLLFPMNYILYLFALARLRQQYHK